MDISTGEVVGDSDGLVDGDGVDVVGVAEEGRKVGVAEDSVGEFVGADVEMVG